MGSIHLYGLGSLVVETHFETLALPVFYLVISASLLDHCLSGSQGDIVTDILMV